jgi:hypothetical protein
VPSHNDTSGVKNASILVVFNAIMQRGWVLDKHKPRLSGPGMLHSVDTITAPLDLSGGDFFK